VDFVAKLKQRIAELTAQREQVIAQAHAVTGALQACQQLLAELTAPTPAPETPADEPAPCDDAPPAEPPS
jgi:hypothetical protein